ncbi:MAG: DUF433 domain-containing protein [Bacteroidetes bacterium]|mgnify:FL=1|nr:DUF433 domain-containing protein [Bacteroidota bacterium]
MILTDRIEINNEIMLGKPIIKGTRITIELILDKLSAGESVEQILQAYPKLVREDVLAALSYATRIMKDEIIYPMAK